MNKNLKHFIFLAILLCSTKTYAQEAQLLQAIPTTKEEFINTEKQALATIEWLEHTPLNEQKQKRKDLYLLLTGWLTNSPTITLQIDANIMNFTEKNPDLMFMFMAGWAKYALENNNDSSLLKGNLAGIRCAMKIYQKGIEMKKDKNMIQLIALEEKGQLESWVEKQLNAQKK